MTPQGKPQGKLGLHAVPLGVEWTALPIPLAKMGRRRCEMCRRRPRNRHLCACGMRVGTGCCWHAESLQCKRCHLQWAALRVASFGLPPARKAVLRQLDPWMDAPGPERRGRCCEPCEGSGCRHATRCLGVCGRIAQHRAMGHQCFRCKPIEASG